jgi:spermidine/putrescine transport system substrate-binding protein
MQMQVAAFRTTRRGWLHSAAAAALAAGCGRGGDVASARDGRVLKVFNWSDYIDDEVIRQFERRTGCTVVYDNYASDSELETRLATGAGSYDVAFPSDRAMIALVAKGLLAPLDRWRLNNFRHLDPKFLALSFDAQNQFSVPYFWGTLAVGVRTDRVKQPGTGLDALFDPQNRGRITMLDDMENVVAAVLGHLGLPLNSVDPAHLRAVKRLLLQQRPLVQAYTSDSYRERLIAGDAWAALGWSGDLLQAEQELRKMGHGEARIRVIIPAGGTMLWLDSMVIPKAAANVELAHAFIDHLLEPQFAVMNALKVNYASPNAAARARLPVAMLADASIYPSPEVLDRCTWLKNRGPDIERIERLWREVRQ